MMLKSAVTVVLGTLVSLAAMAQDVGVVLGARSDNADAETATAEVTGKMNFHGGVISKFDVSGPLQIRTGFLYTQRSFTYAVGGANVGDFSMSYFEIPAGLLWKFSDYGGAFVGPAVSFNLSKSCPGNCNGADVVSLPIALQLGGSFKVAPQIGFEVYYETVPSGLAKELKSPRSVVGNLMITFE